MGRIPANPKAQELSREPHLRQPAEPGNSSQEGNQEGMESCKPPIVGEGRIPELLKLVGQGALRDFSAVSVRKSLSSRKCGRKLLPHGRRDGGTTTWGWLQGGDLGSGMWPFEAPRAGRKDGMEKSQVAERWHMQVSSGWDTRGESGNCHCQESCLGCPAHRYRDAGVGWEPQEPWFSSGLT